MAGWLAESGKEKKTIKFMFLKITSISFGGLFVGCVGAKSVDAILKVRKGQYKSIINLPSIVLATAYQTPISKTHITTIKLF